MDAIILKEDKSEVEISIDSVTVAEILRVYLDEAGVDFVAWKREHPNKPVVLKISSDGKSIMKVIKDTVLTIRKDLENVEKELKAK